MDDNTYIPTIRKKRLSLSYHNIDILIKNLDVVQMNYEIINTLKTNHKKCVYDVIDINDNKRKVIKFIVSSSITDEQMKIYKHFLSCVPHKNFCKINNIFNVSIFTVLVMDYLNGTTLYDYENTDEYKNILFDLIQALKYLHNNKIIHGDIKPHNIIVKHDNTPVFIDYDMCKICVYDKMNVNNIFGTKFFMPPEMTLKHSISPKIDIWSLGVTMLSCIIKHAVPKNIINNDFSEIYNFIHSTIELNKSNITSEYGYFVLQLLSSMLIINDSKRLSSNDLCLLIQRNVQIVSMNQYSPMN